MTDAILTTNLSTNTYMIVPTRYNLGVSFNGLTIIIQHNP